MLKNQKLPAKTSFVRGAILKGEDGQLCEHHLLTPGLKFTCGF